MKKYHYVYKITNNNPADERKYYIGVRSSKVRPEEDTSYKSSSSSLKEDIREIGYDNFNKEILSEWKTREEAIAEEIRLHNENDVAVNSEFYNKAKQTSTGFDISGTVQRKGMLAVLDTRTNNVKKVSIREYNNIDEYVSLHKGKISVLDSRNNTTKMITIEEFNKFDYYISVVSGTVVVFDTEDNINKRVSIAEYKTYNRYVSTMKDRVTVVDTRDKKLKKVTRVEYNSNDHFVSPTDGTVSVIDKRDNKPKRVSVDDYTLYDYYISTSTGTYLVIDTRDGETKRVPTEDYKKYGYYVSVRSKKYKIYDSNDTLKYNVYGSFLDFCKKHNLPSDALKVSHRNNGKPIYECLGSNKKRVIASGMIKYKGWYAVVAD